MCLNADLRKEYIRYFKENAQSYLHVKCSAYVYELFHIHIENNCKQSPASDQRATAGKTRVNFFLFVKSSRLSRSPLSCVKFIRRITFICHNASC